MACQHHRKPMRVETRSPGSHHACAFFDGPEEEYKVLVPFAKECASCGDRCFHFVDPDRTVDRMKVLGEAGVSVSAALGCIELRSWEESYLRGGRFHVEAMLALIREILASGGGRRVSVWANMEWALRRAPGVDGLVEYENRVNHTLESCDCIIVCVYEAGHYSAEIAMDVLRAHPWIVVDGKLEVNPLYVPATASRASP